jgi:hypothetical protein
MRASKRGMELSVGTVIVIVAGLLILAFIVYYASNAFRAASTASDCVARGGRCAYAMEGCHPATEFQQFGAFCSNDNTPVCCVPIERKDPGVDSIRFSTEQRKALADPIYLTQNNNPTPVTSLTLHEGQASQAHIKFNDKLPYLGFGPTIVYLSDPKQPGKVIEPFYFEIKQPSEPVFRAGTSNGLVTGFEGTTAPGDKLTLDLEPKLQHTYGDYTLNVVVLDRVKMICADLTGVGKESYDEDKWMECLENNGNIDGLPVASDTYLKEIAPNYASDPSYRLASKAYKITINPNLKITGVSTSWVAEDVITVTSTDPGFTNLQFRLVNSKAMVGYDQILSACTDESASTSIATPFQEKLTTIIGTTTDTKGIPLNLNIGGFRIPTASVQQKYVVEEKIIKLVNGKAEFKIDKATMLKNFYENGGQNVDLVTGDNAWLCVKSEKMVDGKPVTAYALAPTSLKVDAVAPFKEAIDINIVYPDSVINTPNLSRMYPSISGQRYFYKQYPQVVITCNDMGQSGCASFDYYVQQGNFINLNVNSQNPETAISSAALTIALNELFQYFASKNPEQTICPYLYSNEFRANSRPTIQLRTEGQGMICVRVKDRVGNAVLVWKEIYTPSEMIKKLAVEEVNKEIAEADI